MKNKNIRLLTDKQLQEYQDKMSKLTLLKNNEDRITQLEQQNASLIECILEMSEIVFGE